MIRLIKIRNTFVAPDHMEFMIDGTADKDGLPTDKKRGINGEAMCAPGSTASTADLSLAYRLNNQGEWDQIVGPA